jgi:hypothetical protein
MKHTIRIHSYPTIRQGRRVMVGKGNHWTDSGVSSLMYCYFGSIYVSYNAYYHSPFYNHPIISIGLDTTTPTRADMVRLASLKSNKPDSRQGVEYVQEAMGQYRSVVRCTWNAYHFSAPFTIGEVGLYYDSNPADTDLGDVKDASCGYHLCYETDGSKMKARACVADGTIQAFQVDHTLPLIVEWTIRMAWK